MYTQVICKKTGKKKMYGNKQALKKSSEYTKGFCYETACLFRTYDAQIKKNIMMCMEAHSSSSDYDMMNPDWSDCELEELQSKLQRVWDSDGPGAQL